MDATTFQWGDVYDQIDKRCEDAVERYEKTAPAVARYVDDLYIRINERPDDVRLSELRFLDRLVEEGTWLGGHEAANALLHLLNRLGRPTTGLAGF